MESFVHLDGVLVPAAEARIPVLDRGFLFADAVYEGIGVLDGKLVDFEHHMARLDRSLGELAIAFDRSLDEWWHVLMDLIRANALDEGFLYLQISRGVGPERAYVPPAGLTPTVVAFCGPTPGPGADDPAAPLTLRTAPDLRWARRDIKTTNLLGQVLAKRHADAAGDVEALLITADGRITECGSRSFFIVRDGVIVTRPLSDEILHGVTRRSVLDVAMADGLAVEERIVSLDEALAADEAFATAASSYVQPVVAIDGQPIGDGRGGPVTAGVRERYIANARASFYRPA